MPITDLHSGELITSWLDEDFVYVCWGLTTLSIPTEDFEDFCRELGLAYAEFKKVKGGQAI